MRLAAETCNNPATNALLSRNNALFIGEVTLEVTQS